MVLLSFFFIFIFFVFLSLFFARKTILEKNYVEAWKPRLTPGCAPDLREKKEKCSLEWLVNMEPVFANQS